MKRRGCPGRLVGAGARTGQSFLGHMAGGGTAGWGGGVGCPGGVTWPGLERVWGRVAWDMWLLWHPGNPVGSGWTEPL